MAGDYVRFTRSAISAATPVEFNMPQLDSNQLWKRFKKYYTEFPYINLSLDISLSDDHSWLEKLPWYSKGEAADGQ